MKKFFILALSALILSACSSANKQSEAKQEEQQSQGIHNTFDKYFNDINILPYTQEDITALLKGNKNSAGALLADIETKNDNTIKEMQGTLEQIQDQSSINAKYIIYIANQPIDGRKTAYGKTIEQCAANKVKCDLPLLSALYRKYDFLQKAEPLLKEKLSSVEQSSKLTEECEKGTKQNCQKNYKAVEVKTLTAKYDTIMPFLKTPVIEHETNTQIQTITTTCESGFNAKNNSCRKNFTKTITEDNNSLSGPKTVISCKSSQDGKCLGGGTVAKTGNFCRCGNYTLDITIRKNPNGNWAYESEYTNPHSGYKREICSQIDTVSDTCLNYTEDSFKTHDGKEITINDKLAINEEVFETFNFK